jgi:DsbC/DsbD-like thiol-disulfide interchange protein
MRFAILLFALILNPAHASLKIDASHSSAELLVSSASLRPRESAWLALKITPRKAWHTYWKNPGDAGLPPSLSLVDAKSLKLGEIHWPAPERIQVKQLASYGYDGVIVLPLQLFVDKAAAPGARSVRVRADWLVCEDSCIAQDGEFTLPLEIAAGAARAAAAPAGEIRNALALEPVPAPERIRATARREAGRLVVELQGINAAGELFIEPEQIVEPGPKPQLKVGPTSTQWSAPLGSEGKASPRGRMLDAVWVSHTGSSKLAYRIKLLLE